MISRPLGLYTFIVLSIMVVLCSLAHADSKDNPCVLVLVDSDLDPYIDSELIKVWEDKMIDEGWSVHILNADQQQVSQPELLKQLIYDYYDLNDTDYLKGVILIGDFVKIQDHNFKEIDDLWLTTKNEKLISHTQSTPLKTGRKDSDLNYVQDFWLSRITPPEKNDDISEYLLKTCKTNDDRIKQKGEWVNQYLKNNINARTERIMFTVSTDLDCDLHRKLVCARHYSYSHVKTTIHIVAEGIMIRPHVFVDDYLNKYHTQNKYNFANNGNTLVHRVQWFSDILYPMGVSFFIIIFSSYAAGRELNSTTPFAVGFIIFGTIYYSIYSALSGFHYPSLLSGDFTLIMQPDLKKNNVLRLVTP